MTVDHASLEPGQTISDRRYTLDDAAVSLYVAAVGDRSGLYEAGDGVTPPMAVAALGLRGVVEDLRIPGGTLHTSQEDGVPGGRTGGVRVAVRGGRGAEFGARRPPFPRGRNQDGRWRRPAGAERQKHAGASDVSPAAALREGDALPAVEREIDQTRIELYAEASGDFNPIHVDREYAAGTQFGSTIAHGMMVAAIVSEAMAPRVRQALGGRRADEAQIQGACLPGRHGDRVRRGQADR